MPCLCQVLIFNHMPTSWTAGPLSLWQCVSQWGWWQETNQCWKKRGTETTSSFYPGLRSCSTLLHSLAKNTHAHTRTHTDTHPLTHSYTHLSLTVANFSCLVETVYFLWTVSKLRYLIHSYNQLLTNVTSGLKTLSLSRYITLEAEIDEMSFRFCNSSIHELSVNLP